ncbi:uncharacterized protein FPOAC1_013301 [Fusarium poae]|uniref:uncharacterized protein n=1 Tax=Fusarium poae TaxID=36050 RepID=UPI001D044998|nr:uncharacterized protein FPOAC1_012850 [Fusarium poae]XP_044701825.1 uncharacterized protein FPOAC1_013301 [Fusarium poae]KAG8664873.1 hypothetical protein FPOAC1_012850 [Fusarium poae]KAG8665322.1 hypothetical protein FPOAC1_013301 [Fusarium poae]
MSSRTFPHSAEFKEVFTWTCLSIKDKTPPQFPFSQCAVQYRTCFRHSHPLPMPIKAITKLLNLLIPQTAMRDVLDIANLSYKSSLNGRHDTTKMSRRTHGAGGIGQPRHGSATHVALPFESHAGIGQKPKIDHEEAQPETLRRTTRRRIPTRRAEKLMNNGLWVRRLLRTSLKAKAARKRLAKRAGTANKKATMFINQRPSTHSRQPQKQTLAQDSGDDDDDDLPSIEELYKKSQDRAR